MEMDNDVLFPREKTKIRPGTHFLSRLVSMTKIPTNQPIGGAHSLHASASSLPRSHRTSLGPTFHQSFPHCPLPVTAIQFRRVETLHNWRLSSSISNDDLQPLGSSFSFNHPVALIIHHTISKKVIGNKDMRVANHDGSRTEMEHAM
jgi:hypothetical protein